MPEGNAVIRNADDAKSAVDPLLLKLTKLHYMYVGVTIAWMINLGIAMGFFLIDWMTYGKNDNGFLIGLIFLMVCPVLFTARVLRGMLIYRYWQLLPPEYTSIKPRTAALMLFVPFFNLYWNFVSIVKLGKFLSAKTGDSRPRNNAVLYSIISCICVWRTLLTPSPLGELNMMRSFFKAVKRIRGWQ